MISKVDNFIPYNKPFIIGNELKYISQSVLTGKISGDGEFTKKCTEFLENRYKINKVLLTTSCSSSLDMSAILCNVNKGDEVILPSFTFVSTANSFLIRNADIRFVDIKEQDLNIDENKIAESITSKTKVIVPVHYAGVGCEMDAIMKMAIENNIFVIEDAAQCIEAKYKESYLGTIGDLGCLSFHETKNITCGEGGALLINNKKFIERAEIIREKGTNRSKFYRGEIDKYTWVDIGSSYLLSDILAAFLFAQLEKIDDITENRVSAWNYYYQNLEELEKKGFLRRPFVKNIKDHNGHIFYILLENETDRDALMSYLKNNNILSVFHYVPLHLSPIGKKLGYKKGQLPITEKLSALLLRLPLFYGIKKDEQDKVMHYIYQYAKKNKSYKNL